MAQAKIIKQKYPHHHSTATFIISLVAFVLLAGVIAFTVTATRQDLTPQSLADTGGTPSAWNIADQPLASAESAVNFKFRDGFIEYTAYIRNTSTEPLSITHLASYLSGVDGRTDGFMTLDNSTIEYTQAPTSTLSWARLDLTAPSLTLDGFKLTEPIKLTAYGSNQDTAYFRYKINTDSVAASIINNRISFLTSSTSQATAYAYSETAVAHQPNSTTNSELDSQVSATTNTNGYVSPLGVSDSVSEVNASSQTIASVMGQPKFNNGNIAFIALGVFIVSLVVYLTVHRLRLHKARS